MKFCIVYKAFSKLVVEWEMPWTLLVKRCFYARDIALNLILWWLICDLHCAAVIHFLHVNECAWLLPSWYWRGCSCACLLMNTLLFQHNTYICNILKQCSVTKRASYHQKFLFQKLNFCLVMQFWWSKFALILWWTKIN